MQISNCDENTEIKQEDCKDDKNFENDTFTAGTTAMNTIVSTQNFNEMKGEIKSEVKDEIDTKCSEKKPGDSLLASITHKVQIFYKINSLLY